MNTLIVNSYRNDLVKKIDLYVNLVKQFSTYDVIDDTQAIDKLGSYAYDAVILSGSPDFVSQERSSQEYFDFVRYNTIPCLGICYGHQVLAKAYGATVYMGRRRIEGYETVRVIENDPLFEGMPPEILVWENHLEHVELRTLDRTGFALLANSSTCEVEVIKHMEKPLYGLQFHPERSGIIGERIFKNFFDTIKKETKRLSEVR